jgi:beta-glucanase (GH16 family)
MSGVIVRAQKFIGSSALFLLILAFPTYAASSQATRLGFGSVAQTIPLGNCAAVQVVTENSLMQPTGVSAAVTVALSAGSSNVEFFSDAVCGVASASLVVPAGQQSETFFIAGSKAGSYSLSIKATGFTAASQMEVISAATPVPCAGNQAAPTAPPAQASAAGFKTLVFDDEFNSTNTISPNNSGTYNWYTYNPYTASSELNSNDVQVSNGCLTILTDLSGYSDGLSTIDSTSSKTGIFQHGYFEARMQSYPAGWTAGAWPAFWSYSIEALQGKSPFAELDFLEAYPGGLGGATQGANGVTLLTTVHQWTTINGTNVSVQQPNVVPTLPVGFNYDAYHIYGCLWTTNNVTWYIDNQPVMTVKTGPGTNFSALEQDHMYLVLGTGTNWPVSYDYVHVWH